MVSSGVCSLVIDLLGWPGVASARRAIPFFFMVLAMDFFVNVVSFWMSWLSHFWDFSLFQYVWYIFFFVFIWSFVSRLVHL